MLETDNFNRNVTADQSRIEFWGEGPTLRRIFSTREYCTLWSFLRPRWPVLLLLAVLSFALASVEGAKALALVGLIKGFVASETELSQLLTFSIMNQFFRLSEINLASSRVGLVAILFAMLLVLILLAAGTKLINTWVSKRVELHLMRDVRKAALNKIFSFDLEYFSHARSGELLFLMSSETSRFSNIINFGCYFLSHGFQTLILASMLFYLFWDFSLIVLATIIIFFLVHLKLDVRLKEKSWGVNLSQNQLAHFFHQIIYGIKMIKIGGLEQREEGRYFDQHQRFESQCLRLTLLGNLSGMAQEMVTVIVSLLLIVYVYFFKDVNALLANPGELLAYLFLLTRTMSAGAALQQSRSAIIGAYGPLARVMALLHTENGQGTVTQVIKDGLPQARSISQLSTRGLGFSYMGRDSALKDITLDFKAGTLSALVALSGSGKSTLMDLLSSVRHPSVGKICVDGVPLSHLGMLTYRSSVGYVNQEPIIFHDTVRANVTYFKPDASDDEVWGALRLAAADEFVKGLPDGLDTGMGERGLTLSGGERQRIGLARVFLQSASILLLDEATNALDYETEKQIYKNLERMREGRIIIVAAHRLSVVKDFDQIIVLHEGVVKERGKHQDLMANQKLYFNLYKIQENGSLRKAFS